MKSNAEHTCPVCEFEKGNSGEAVKQADGMVCLSCGASWKIIASENNQEVMPNAADYKLASSALVDNRVFNKRHYEAPKQQSNAAIPEKQTSAYGVAAMCFVLLISAGLFLQTWVWLNPEAKELTLSKVELQEMVSQNGSNVYQVRGVLSNETSKSKQVPRIAIVLKSAEGKLLVRWYHNSPIVSLKSNSQKQFASSIIHVADNVAYAEASLQE